MADCALLEGCLFFNDSLGHMPATSELIKSEFCRGDSWACARFIVASALGRARVPADLYPQDVRRAESIVRSAVLDG